MEDATRSRDTLKIEKPNTGHQTFQPLTLNITILTTHRWRTHSAEHTLVRKKEQLNVVGLHYTVDTFLHERRNPQIEKSIRKMSDTPIFDQALTRALVKKVRTHQHRVGYQGQTQGNQIKGPGI